MPERAAKRRAATPASVQGFGMKQSHASIAIFQLRPLYMLQKHGSDVVDPVVACRVEGHLGLKKEQEEGRGAWDGIIDKR